MRRTFLASSTTSEISNTRCGSSRCLFSRKMFISDGSSDDRSVTRSSFSGFRIRNPLNEDLVTLRSSLLPSLMNIFRLNKHRELPQRVFEISDVVLDARNVRRIGAAALHHKASFTEVKSLVLSLMRDVGQSANVDGVEDANFIPGRAASVMIDAHEIGRFGEVHPRILEAYSLVQPVMEFELDV